MHENSNESEHVSLGKAARYAPGRPSANCMWRWARRGVLARNGERVRLKHVRAGGKIFTTPAWVREFCDRLAATDAEYFDAKDAAAKQLPPRDPRYGPPSRRGRVRQSSPPTRRVDLREVDRELEEDGL